MLLFKIVSYDIYRKQVICYCFLVKEFKDPESYRLVWKEWDWEDLVFKACESQVDVWKVRIRIFISLRRKDFIVMRDKTR